MMISYIYTVNLVLTTTLLALCSNQVTGDVVHLTKDSYDAMTEGKAVFIKFYAPWCVHSKKIAPEWERLAADWDKSDVGLIAKVDCTDRNGGKQLCDEFSVNGFPTFLYGDPGSLTNYKGGRSYQDLAAFAKENLTPPCSPTQLDLCDMQTKNEIQQLMNMPDEAIKKLIDEEKQKLKNLSKEFKAKTKELEEQYNQLLSEKDLTIKEIKASGLGIAKTIKAYKEKMDQNDRAGDEL